VAKPLWPSTEPGTLRHTIAIQSQSVTPDSFGQPQQRWTTVRTSKASIQALTLREIFQANQLTSQVTHLITVRWTPSVIRPGMRIAFGSRIFQSQAVNNLDERNLLVKMLALELNAQS